MSAGHRARCRAATAPIHGQRRRAPSKRAADQSASSGGMQMGGAGIVQPLGMALRRGTGGSCHRRHGRPSARRRPPGGNDTLVGGDRCASNALTGDATTIAGRAGVGATTCSSAVSGPVMPSTTTACRAMVRSCPTTPWPATTRWLSACGTNDLMYGDAPERGADVVTGRDTFAFGPSNGQDLIGDFEPGKDTIELRGFGFHGVQGRSGADRDDGGGQPPVRRGEQHTVLGAAPGAHDIHLIG